LKGNSKKERQKNHEDIVHFAGIVRYYPVRGIDASSAFCGSSQSSSVRAHCLWLLEQAGGAGTRNEKSEGQQTAR